MKIIIAGSRNFSNYNKLKEFCNKFLLQFNICDDDIEIISGTANGADKLGERYANEMGFKIIRFPADWNRFGKSAGYRRNEEMAEYADVLIAFWDGKSKGTKHIIDLANDNGLKFLIKYF